MNNLRFLVIVSFINLIVSTPIVFGENIKHFIPHQLSQTDRHSALLLLGPATSSRVLSSPYPLGGFQGIEVSLSRQNIPFTFLNSIGDKKNDQRDLDYSTLTIGKGLYYNIDLFLSFIPMIQYDSLSHFSTQIRYQFWQSNNNFFRLSGILHSSTSNIDNQISLQSYGYDFVGTTTIDRVSLFIGIGNSTNRGRFIGGKNGLTDNLETVTEVSIIPHQLIGIEWPIANFFWAAQVDRFNFPFYAFKFGYRM